MKRRAIILLTALAAGAAQAETAPAQPQASQPAVLPAMTPVLPEGFNPFMLMSPYGAPAQPMPYGAPAQPMPFGLPQMPQAMPMPPQMPYGMTMPQMPQGMQMPQAMQMPQMPYGGQYPMMAAPQQPGMMQLPQFQLPQLPQLPQFPQMPPAGQTGTDPLTALATSLAQAAGPVLTAVTPAATSSSMQSFNPLLLLNTLLEPNKPKRDYEMRRTIQQGEKTAMLQMMLPLTTGILNMGMPEAMNYFARKYKAKPGLTFDEVRESLMLRGNQTNMKYVGENLMWKDFQAVLDDKTAPRIEVLSFCDIAVARDLLKLSPEFVVFLPCRIAIMEDADKNIWLLMVDWNMDWVKGYEQKLGLTPELIKGAESINVRMDEMMRAAANGDL